MSTYTARINHRMTFLYLLFCLAKVQVYDSGVVVIEYSWTDPDAKQEYETLEEIRRIYELSEGHGNNKPCYP